MEPFFDGCKVDEAKEHTVEFFKACGDTAQDLHSLKEVFNEVPCFVAIFVQGPWLLAICLGRDDHLHASFLRTFNDLIGVIRLVRNDRLGWHTR